MAIGQVLEVLSPPASPINASPDWAKAEAELGTALPPDYRAFIETYGSGRIAELLWVFNPADRRETINLLVQSPAQREVLRELAEMGETIPYPVFPEPGGLLPFGMSDNGDVLHWRAQGAPEQWTVVVQEARGPEFSAHDADLTGFLAGVLGRTIRCPVFHRDFPKDGTGFEIL
jgi:hypothetical protein